MATPLHPKLAEANNKPCVCLAFPVQQQQQKEYTDAEFAKDMEGLSFQERQKVNEDVHLVADQVQETPEFVDRKVHEIIEVLKNQSKNIVQRDAWDRAVFLRPSLARDRDHYLMFLRAKNYDAFDAAILIFKHNETKRRVWGEELLARRISWEDLSEETRAYYRKGYVTYLPRNRENSCRRVCYIRAANIQGDIDPMEYMRAITYAWFSTIIGNDELQRGGLITVSDLRGQWNMSTLQFLEFARIVAPMLERYVTGCEKIAGRPPIQYSLPLTIYTFSDAFNSMPVHIVVMHFLIEGNGMASLARSHQSLFSRNYRLRARLHVGSWIEIQYSLRSYGINITADWLEGDDVKGSPFSRETLGCASQEYLDNEAKWTQADAPYCDPTSKVALYPNRQDIIMGKNRTVAWSWPGNLYFDALIRQQANIYGAATNNLEKRRIVQETLQRLELEHNVRFLTRKENIGWEAISTEDARVKVSQSLRDEYRKMSRRAPS